MIRNLRGRALILLVISTAVACGDDNPAKPSKSVDFMEVRPSRITLLVGQSETLYAFAYSHDGSLVEDATFRWRVDGVAVVLSLPAAALSTLVGVRCISVGHALVTAFLVDTSLEDSASVTCGCRAGTDVLISEVVFNPNQVTCQAGATVPVTVSLDVSVRNSLTSAVSITGGSATFNTSVPPGIPARCGLSGNTSWSVNQTEALPGSTTNLRLSTTEACTWPANRFGTCGQAALVRLTTSCGDITQQTGTSLTINVPAR